MEWAANVEAAKKALTEDVFDVVCLDHDIGGQMLACNENCGCNVAEFIKTLPASRVPLVVLVHSMNPDGATRMMGTLDGAGVWETFRLIIGSFHFKGKEIVVG